MERNSGFLWRHLLTLVSNSFVDSQRLTQADPSRTPGNNAVHPGNLDLSVVEYASPHKVGQGLKIKFVQNMVDHLRFDPTAGELSIFAWPSICLANLAGRAENGTGVALASLYDTALFHFCRYDFDI